MTVTTLRVHLIPNAKVDQIVGKHGDAIKIKVRAPAVEGKANAALRRCLGEKLQIAQNAIVLERGQTSRNKVIGIHGLSEKDVYHRLLGAV